MPFGFFIIMAAQFFSSLADNALLVAAIATLALLDSPAWLTPMLGFVVAFSVLQATRLPPLPGKKFWEGSKPQYLFFTTTIFLLRGKAIQLAVYSLFEGQDDVDWLKNITLRWHDELQRLNPR